MSGEGTLTGCGIGPVDLKICHQSKTSSFKKKKKIVLFYFIIIYVGCDIVLYPFVIRVLVILAKMYRCVTVFEEIVISCLEFDKKIDNTIT